MSANRNLIGAGRVLRIAVLLIYSALLIQALSAHNATAAALAPYLDDLPLFMAIIGGIFVVFVSFFWRAEHLFSTFAVGFLCFFWVEYLFVASVKFLSISRQDYWLLSPFLFLVSLLTSYALLGSTWLIGKSDGLSLFGFFYIALSFFYFFFEMLA